MTIQEALNKAVKEGYHVNGTDGVATSYSGANSEYSVWTRTDNQSSFMIGIEETVLDPAFWTSLFGDKGGRKMAVSMMQHVFDGGSIESFFRDYVAPPSCLPTWLQRKRRLHAVNVYPSPRRETRKV